MAKYLELEIGAMSWPQCCARCLRKDLLVQYEDETIKSTRNDYLIVVTWVARKYKNIYPVCKIHHAEISRSEILYKVLNAVLIGTLLVSLVPIWMYLELGKQGDYAALAVLAICALLYFRRLVINKVPIWVSEIGEDFVVLRFSNNKYAEEFVRVNKEICKPGGELIDLLR